jgi:hypothetical protein
MAKNKEEQTKQWPKTKNRQSNDKKQRTDKAMTKNKEEQTKQWPKTKNRQSNDQKQ